MRATHMRSPPGSSEATAKRIPPAGVVSRTVTALAVVFLPPSYIAALAQGALPRCHLALSGCLWVWGFLSHRPL
ncbi:hypothetical protein P7K49_001480 [Saguinus oedipus]|uniref:Uncharacterized protein n=1 Tax=Saguinus oedipus TaxID=9490 RepID=A0ABQ9WEM9_SAGOE|nr:hypothetical protein P7K49_001480 [Saguinus oedipus]